MLISSNNVYIDGKFTKATLKIVAGKIENIIYGKCLGTNYEDNYIIPGFVDVHVHGWARGSFWGEKTINSLEKMSHDLAKEGVTSFLATTGSDSIEQIDMCVESLVAYKKNELKSSAVVGLHLEGPFLNTKFKGMQPEENIILGDIRLFEKWYSDLGDMLKLVTIAPEFEANLEIIKKYGSRIRFNAGHTDATYDQIKEGIKYGLSGITHTFSGQRPMHHRELGTAGAAMEIDELYVEVAKQTGLTIKPEAFRLLYKIKPKDRFILTSDAVGYGAFPKGEFFYNYIRGLKFVNAELDVEVISDEGDCYSLSKSSYDDMCKIELSFNESVKNILQWHKDIINIKDIIRIGCENPAKYIKVFHERGSIDLGKYADLQVVDSNFNLNQVYCEGEKIL